MEPWLVAPITLLALLLAVLCHRRLCAIFPEDQPGQTARKQHPEADCRPCTERLCRRYHQGHRAGGIVWPAESYGRRDRVE